MRRASSMLWICAAVAVLGTSTQANDLRASLKSGSPKIRSAGPMAFGPEGILFLADPQSAAIFAIDTGDASPARSKSEVNVEAINLRVAEALGTSAQQIQINDLAVNPASGAIYLSVSRGRGPNALPVVLRVGSEGQIEEVPLDNVRYSKVELTNAPPDAGTGRDNQRRESITDLAFIDGRVIVAGLSNEEFASKLRAIPFPFSKADAGTSVEIYHGAHGRFETRSPVRTFVSYEIEGEPHLLAAYTCTPLVKFPVSELEPGKKVRGTTIAELGNRNRPLDMVAYEREGKSYILMANSARGLMKISTEGIESIQGIEEKIDGTAGLPYETIDGLDGVVQLDQLDNERAVVLIEREEGRTDLKTIELP
jgi:hypothetical protein